MNVGVTFSINAILAAKLETKARALGVSKNKYMESVLRKVLEEQEVITCKCGCEYSSKLPFCPSCQSAEFLEWQGENEQKTVEATKKGMEDELSVLREKKLKAEETHETMMSMFRDKKLDKAAINKQVDKIEALDKRISELECKLKPKKNEEGGGS